MENIKIKICNKFKVSRMSCYDSKQQDKFSELSAHISLISRFDNFNFKQ